MSENESCRSPKVETKSNKAMKHYRVHLSEEHCADSFVDAETKEQAEEIALHNAMRADWCDFELVATDTDEVDENGDPVK